MVLFEGEHSRTEPTLNAWEMQRLMGLGINLGNVLETPFQGKFADMPTDENFHMFHDAGFANVRLPVHWNKHMMVKEPYTLDATFLKEVQEIVDKSLAHGLVTVITCHNEWWIDVDDENSKNVYEWKYESLPRFEALWRQVAAHFRHHRQLLIFGILNEPHQLSVASLNELHRCALVAIRETNPSRVVTISGKNFANPRWLLKNPDALWIPRDPQVMLEIHNTEPHGITGTDPTITPEKVGKKGQLVWGSDQDLQKLVDWVHRLELFARARNLPVYCAEFGCSDEQCPETRRAWIEANWQEMRAKGFSASLWDDGDRHTIYSRKDGQWDQDILVALQRSLPGMKGVGFRRAGGGLGGDSVDPTIDLQRHIEMCFKKMQLALDHVDALPELEEHEYISHEFADPDEFDSDAGNDDIRSNSSAGGYLRNKDSSNHPELPSRRNGPSGRQGRDRHSMGSLASSLGRQSMRSSQGSRISGR